MALQHLRSSTANKRPTPGAMSDGQLAMNTNTGSPGLFLKDSNGDLIKIGPIHVGTTAPNVTPAAGGEAGNSKGEQWLDTSSSRYVFKIWDGAAWRTEDGEFVNASGDTMTGALVMDNQQQVRFRETTANGTNFIALQAPASVTADRTLTLPDVTGTIVSTGDTGSVTSTMILDGTIVNADINASAAIAGTKISPDFGSQTIVTTGVHSAAVGSAAAPSIAFTGDLSTGIYSPGADQVAISTGGTARVLVDGGGGVDFASTGIRVAASTIHKTVNTGELTLFGGTSGDGANIELYGSTSASANHVVIDADVHLFRSQAGNEHARIDSSGNLLVRRATNTDTAALCVDADAASGGLAISTITTLTTLRFHQVFRNANGQVGGISTTGSATTYSTSSDYRLKENIVPLDGAIDRLNQLSVHRFNFIADPDTVVDGFIAHEAAAVVPECVTGVKDEEDEDGEPIYQGIDQSKIVPLLTAALQEAIAKIEALEARIAALEA